MGEKLSFLKSEFHISQVGFAFLLCVMSSLNRMSRALPDALSMITSSYACMFSLGIGCVVGLIVVVNLSKDRSAEILNSMRFGIVGLCLSCAICSGFLFALFFPSYVIAPVLVLLSYFLLGLLLTVVFIGWIMVFSQLNLMTILPLVAFELTFAYVLNAGVQYVISPILACLLYFFMLALSSLLLLVSMRRRSQSETTISVNKESTLQTQEPYQENAQTASKKKIISIVPIPAIALSLQYFNNGALAVPDHKYAIDQFPLWDIVGGVIVVLVFLLLFTSFRSTTKTQEILQRIMILTPLLAFFTGCFAFVRILDAGGYLKHVLSLLGAVGSEGLEALFVVYIAFLFREDVHLSFKSFCSSWCLMWIAFLFGLVAMYFWGNDGLSIEIVLLMVFMLVLNMQQLKGLDVSVDSNIRERCHAIAQSFELSRREEEILVFLAFDTTINQIAEELVISPDTVRTHRKHIYGKVGVHKREELARLIREIDPQQN